MIKKIPRAEDPLFAADRLDQPPYEGPRYEYLICSTPRTGSNLLCELLRVNGAGVPMEYFHRTMHMPLLLRRYGLTVPAHSNDTVNIEKYIEALRANRTSVNGYFGIKTHWGQFNWLNNQCDIDKLFPRMKYVFISREDELTQAVSASKAAQSRQWNSEQKKNGLFEYNEEHIKFCLKTIRKSNRKWKQVFESRDIQPFKITFENLISSTESVFQDLVEFLDISNHDISVDLSQLTIKKQSNAVNREWIGRYKKQYLEES